MARISTYALDAKPEINDKVIGTDNGIGEAQRTKNYPLSEVMALFNERNLVAVADQVIFEFQSDILEGREPGTISFEAGEGEGTPFSDVTQILISKKASGNKTVAQYLPLFIDKDIILAEVGSINNFGTYKVMSITTDVAEPNFFLVTLKNYASNGAIALNGYYIFSEFVNPAIDAGDKNYVHPQEQASAIWTVQHNLNKFPSCTMVLSTGQQGYGDVTFIDENELTITFAGAESGKAYIN